MLAKKTRKHQKEGQEDQGIVMKTRGTPLVCFFPGPRGCDFFHRSSGEHLLFFAAEVLAFLQVFPGLLGVVEVPTQYSRSWPLKKLMHAQGPPHMGTILVPRARGTPVKTKQKWGAHSVRADNLVLALQLRTIPSFKRADNDEKGLEQTRKAKSTLSEQWENAEADHRQRIQTDSEVQARRRVHYRKDRPNADLTDKSAPVK